MKPFLSICIPTYNRSKYIRETVENIFQELSGMPSETLKEIEICISDNASTDNSVEILVDLKQKSPVAFSLNVNDTNLGVDRNILKVSEMSESEYVWLLSSDDLLENGALNYVYKFLKVHKDIDVLVMTDIAYDSSMTYRMHEVEEEGEDQILFFASQLDASMTIAHPIGLISHVCFKRSLWMKIENRESFIGCLYIHTPIILSMVRDGARVAYILNPATIKFRFFNDSIVNELGWYKKISLMLDFTSKIPRAVYGENSVEGKMLSKRLVKQIFPPRVLEFWLLRLTLSQRLEFMRKFYSYYKNELIFYFTTYPLLLSPFGSNGKLLYLFPVELVSKKVHSQRKY